MDKHTPGPWAHHPEDNIITAAGAGRITLIEFQARSLYVSIEERDANARLIAAAPDLLEALRSARLELWRLLDAKGITPKDASEWPEIACADAAIKKATRGA
jgi:hypothetical protein